MWRSLWDGTDAERHEYPLDHPVYSSSDYEDAYCHADRSKILSGIARVIPALLPPIHRHLEAVQDVIYFGSESGLATIKQAVGLTQGQATSGQLCSLGVHPSYYQPTLMT